METLKEYVEKVRAHLLTDLTADEARTGDPIIGQFMKGRVVIENHYLKTLDQILDMLKKEE